MRVVKPPLLRLANCITSLSGSRTYNCVWDASFVTTNCHHIGHVVNKFLARLMVHKLNPLSLIVPSCRPISHRTRLYTRLFLERNKGLNAERNWSQPAGGRAATMRMGRRLRELEATFQHEAQRPKKVS